MEWLNPIITDYKTYEAEYLTLEPLEKLAATGTEGRLLSIRTRWLGTVHHVRTKLITIKPYIYTKKAA